MQRSKRRFALNRETLQQLTPDALRQAAGGVQNDSNNNVCQTNSSLMNGICSLTSRKSECQPTNCELRQ